MVYNINAYFWGDILSGIPAIIGLIVSSRQFFKQRYRQNLYLALIWLFLTFWQYGLALAELTLSITIKILSDYCIIICCLFVCLLVDAVSKEYVDPIKISITHILGAIVIFTSFGADAIIIGPRVPNGPTSIYSNSWFKYSGSILILFFGITIVIYFARIYLAAPKGLKKFALFNLLGALIAALITPIGFALNLSNLVPGLTNLLFGIGLLLCAISFTMEPKLAYILPFKALRLTVVNTKSGLSIFTHDWTRDNHFIDDVLFSGMMQGISAILGESLKKGNVNEIILDKAHLLIEHTSENEETACILVATKSTIGLRTALSKFIYLFVNEFDPILADVNETRQFDRASVLVDKCFPFVPEYE